MVRFSRILFVAILIASSAFAQTRIECSTLKSRILNDIVHYCVLLPPDYDAPAKTRTPAKRYPILYFLHGLGDDEKTLFKTGGLNIIDDFREEKKIGDFLMVTPEARASFYVNSADGKVRYSDFFIEEFIPYIEGKYRVERSRGSRAISGISMGGYGALRFAFTYPKMFSAVSAQSPALMTESPQELNAALRAGTPKGKLLGAIFGNPIDPGHWRANDPILLAKKNPSSLKNMAIYFNCGDSDQYGFETGTNELDKELKAEGIAHEYHLYPGDHSIGYFLSHFAEVLQFHTEAFTKTTQKK
jgi:S-formylglutathione hydrolase FrmB